MDYTFFRIIQNDPDIMSLAHRYKTLRLQGLQQSPSAFSSTHEIESQFSDGFWASRLQAKGRETFICATQSGDWVVQVTLRGPLSVEDYRLPPAAGQPDVLPSDIEEKWQMLSLYTLPDYRGKSLGKRLCRAAFAYLVSLERAQSKVRVRIMVKPENTATLHLYKSLGFEDAGRCTLEEALRANGDSELLPHGDLPEKYTTRTGLIMDLSLNREPLSSVEGSYSPVSSKKVCS
ncbi:hypothetical protein PFICI_03348 [Pestalotiopsis fici W106-1]|uniref:N-acetyltransferase domain-containing protein n=1 Tax=Pestalotiopsis fici (strain W106-1 / CGMCC3.15140) TaxID=1229662 RepID=W3XGV9_PESFW|nr:uncharacterized protein PFICI_03348 [Pestalotiopsis fici W106-1]ETS85323.1 hypothetical protein PFICI_03348 [Pestalotiopsis fici W106-1]